MFIGNKQIVDYLEKIIEHGRIGQGFLFHGPSHVGKMTLALDYAAALLCKTSGKLDGCGKCEHCKQIENSAHPSVTILEAGRPISSDETSGKSEIGIKDIHEVQRRLSLTHDGIRIFIIKNAETLSREAEHAFLKILEEPPAGILFILTAELEDALLPTIRSRVIRFAFFPVSEKELKRMPDARNELIKISGGLPGILHRLIHDNEFREEEVKRNALLEKIFGGHVSTALAVSETVAENKEEHDFMRTFFQVVEMKVREITVPSREHASKLEEMLSIFEYMQTTNVNARLGMDLLFVCAAKFLPLTTKRPS